LEDWTTKITLEISKYLENFQLKNNSFGLLFLLEVPHPEVILMPLNEKPNFSVEEINYTYSLQFQREFIEEDDVEYALDVLNLFKLSEKQRLNLDEKTSNNLTEIINFLRNELQSSNANYQIIKSLLKVLLLHLIRFQKASLLPQDHLQNKIYQFLQLLELNFKTEISAKFYAQKLDLSSKRLNQILKEKLGQTATQLVRQRQITEIKRELQKKNKSIKELAFDYQFNSVSAFSRFFKRHTKFSPKQFKMWQ